METPGIITKTQYNRIWNLEVFPETGTLRIKDKMFNQNKTFTNYFLIATK